MIINNVVHSNKNITKLSTMYMYLPHKFNKNISQVVS